MSKASTTPRGATRWNEIDKTYVVQLIENGATPEHVGHFLGRTGPAVSTRYQILRDNDRLEHYRNQPVDLTKFYGKTPEQKPLPNPQPSNQAIELLTRLSLQLGVITERLDTVIEHLADISVANN